ncbi:MAG: ABC transporter permease [Candidatus Riflebacteria bacterium]|nr:ABC transporter permease [Candidatus Riflebacteria bacterium]
MAIPLSYNVRNLAVRKATTVMTALGIALTVAVLVAVLAMVDGLRSSLVATGNPLHVLVMRKGSTSELTSSISRDAFRDIKFKPGIALFPSGDPQASLEMVTVIMLESPEKPEGINITLRGLSPAGFALREGVKMVDGRMFAPGAREVIVGASIAARYPMARPGRSLRFGRCDWTVVGVFDAGRSAASSELFAELDQVSADYNRREVLSSVLVRAADASAVQRLIKTVESDRRLNVMALTELAYYEQQTVSAGPIRVMGYLIAIIMAIGSSFAAMNTMYAAVARRSAEIGTLRVLGFSRRAILASFVLESALLSLLGGLLGCLVVVPLNGIQTGMGNFVTFSEITFGLHVGPGTVAIGVAFALVMGVIGGFFPARMAANRTIVATLRES